MRAGGGGVLRLSRPWGAEQGDRDKKDEPEKEKTRMVGIRGGWHGALVLPKGLRGEDEMR